MIETALVDGDIVAYRCAAATKNDTVDIAKWQVSEMMRRILHETNAMQYRCFLSGSDNFRYSIYPDYKANRRDMEKPQWLQAVREHLVSVWNATVTDGIEADDAMGILQCASNTSDQDSTIIITIDKDLLMIPGRHYAFETSGVSSLGNRWTKPAVFQTVSPLEGLRNFYAQLILGDRADNIPGYDGKMRQKVPNFLLKDMEALYAAQDEFEMFEHVKNMYNDDEALLRSGQCLWIQRKEGDLWSFPVERKEALDRCTSESVYNLGIESGE
jgi:5'-3' exonuclease